MSYSDRQPWMSDDQWSCAQLIAEVFGGFHHLKPFRDCSGGVRVLLHQRDLSTFDFSHLTALVVAAHDQHVRVAVCVAGMHLEVRAYMRRRDGDISDRHPTLEEHVAKLRRQPAQATATPSREELKTALREANKSREYWQDLYNREVLGLNNEGDPIGGPPASGLKHRVDRLEKIREELMGLLRDAIDHPGDPYVSERIDAALAHGDGMERGT